MERENPSPQNSPKSNGGSYNMSASSSSTTNNNNGAQHHQQQQQPQFLQTPPLTPKPISSRSETTNPYPTTFVQADTTTFKHVVQMLTGSPSHPPPQDPPASKGHVIPPVKTAPRKQSFKLYERRSQAQNLKNSLMINTLVPGLSSAANSGFSPRRQQEILSPSILDFPKLALNSPVTPLNDDPFNRASPSLGNSSSEEDRAIAEKGFYLHPSPMSTPRDGAEPQLLPLFPVSSPRVSGSSS